MRGYPVTDNRDPKGEPTRAAPALRPAARPGSAPLKGPPRANERTAPPPRGKLASAEEISASLILPDDEPKAKAPPPEGDAEELSGSLLLDDPSGPRGPERAVIMPAVVRPGSTRPGSVKPPVPRSVKPPPPRSVKPPPPRSVKPPPPRVPAGLPQAAPHTPPPPQVSAPPQVPAAPPGPEASPGHTNGLEHSNGLVERAEAAHAGAPPGGAAVAGATRVEARHAEPTPMPDVAHLADDANDEASDDGVYEAKTLPIGAVPAVVLERITAKAAGNAAPAEPAGPEASEPAERDPAEPGPAEPELPALPLHRGLDAGQNARRMIERVATAAREWQRHPFEGELPPWFLWASTGAGIAAGAGAALLIACLLRPAPAPPVATAAVESPATAPSAESAKVDGVAASAGAAVVPAASAPVVPAASASAAPVPAAPPSPPQACRLSGAPAILAPAAVLSAGIEVRAPGEDDVLLGFAANEHEAVGLRFRPATSSTTPVGTTTARERNPVRRVTPFVSATAKGGLELVVDSEAKGDALAGRRTLPFEPPIQLGTSPDGLAWAKPGAAPAGKLWPLDGDGDVQALRAAVDPTAPSGPVAVAFRRNDAIDIGFLTPGDPPAPKGDLVRI